MSDTQMILAAAGIRTAVIVDDAYDDVPLASDLALEGDEWTHFFDDLSFADRELLGQIFQGFGAARADDLRNDSDFVAALWSERARVRPELVEPVFARYIADTAANRLHLDALSGRLRELGLGCDVAGRSFEDIAKPADLIFVDLFLGSNQDEAAIETSIRGVAKVIAARLRNPPLVVLMSQSTRLADKREAFRDRTGLFESAFRIMKKAELSDPGRLDRLLSRLGRHYRDSLKLAEFLFAWQEGLKTASTRTAGLLRALDLSDHAQIRRLLLSEEQEPTGSYMVDVFDRVLLHEIEGERAIIDSAVSLNSLTSASYPPPYLVGPRNLQDLVHRSVFQNRERLRLSGAEGSPVAFGDILRRKRGLPAGAATTGDLATDLGESGVFAVLTPACDLQRGAAKRILLLVGSVQPLTPADWTYAEDPVRTPVVVLADEQPGWIRWDLAHIETISQAGLAALLAAADGVEIVARLRETHALELQQKLLSGLGRVGLLAPMPATFPMRVEVHLPGVDGRLTRLEVPGLVEAGGVCYVGRPAEKEKNVRLVLVEDMCEAICAAVASVNPDHVHTSSQEALKHLKSSEDLLLLLEGGVTLPGPQQREFTEILSPSGATTSSTSRNVRAIGLVSRNRDVDAGPLVVGSLRKAGVVLLCWDLIKPAQGRPAS